MKTRAKTVVKLAAAIAIAVVAAAFLYVLLFGPLFAFSPLTFGFDELRLARSRDLALV